MAETRIPRIPTATYRLQFRNGMTFQRAEQLIPHLKSLGISHLYASPIFAAVSGSTHGYDVTDPNEIEPELGGIDGFRRLSDSLRTAGLGLILDIVPNHMAASLESPYWRDVVKWGRRSRWAPFFDNDWEQKLTLPVLGDRLESVIEAGHGALRWVKTTDELVFDYYGAQYPIDPSTYPIAFRSDRAAKELRELASAASPENWETLADHMKARFGADASEGIVSGTQEILALLESQPWRMIHWREAARGLSYRRFFEITGLVGVRVEDPSVFATTHRLVQGLVAEGRVQGLRVDHIDGLADPAGYLKRLRQDIGRQTFLVVEKILEGDEQLPKDWPVDGTTGYEFITDLAGLLTAESPVLDRAWHDIAPEFGEPEVELHRAKRLLAEVNFEGEISALVRRAQKIAECDDRPDFSVDTLTEAVRALVAGFGVYRTYGTAEGLGDPDMHVLTALFRRLGQASSELQPAIGFLEDVLFARVREECMELASTFRTRLQHLTGPVLAKSLEDTFFYRYNRLIALNEVGGNPIETTGDIGRFHRRMRQRRENQPHGLSATATHDTKRGEDARARLYAISEAPEDWIAAVTRWRQDLSRHVASLPDGPAPEPAVEWLIFQALAGMLPHDFDPTSATAREEIVDRFLPYVEKALREAKLRTNWSDVNETYEVAVKNYVSSAIASEAFIGRFWQDIRPFVRTGLINSLSQTLIKLTAPGIPDIYQGAEASDTSLVDPDNRRIPDFGRFTTREEPPPVDDFAATKTWLIRRGLALRNRHAELFVYGRYSPLETSGKCAANVAAFARQYDDQSVITVVPRLVHGAVSTDTLLAEVFWGDTAIGMPHGIRQIVDALGDAEFRPAGTLRVAKLFAERPFALLLTQN
jgi:(1->4)-alpha-D-glucan 1-alpha-D-glucosylmutase